jgi:hypothetical protein
VKFQKGNKLAQGGKRPGAGRPTEQERSAKEEMMRIALDTLKMSMAKAVETLVEHLSSEQENISIRAAESVIEYALRAHENQELETRIAALEERLLQQGNR